MIIEILTVAINSEGVTERLMVSFMQSSKVKTMSAEPGVQMGVDIVESITEIPKG